ncbi:MAG: hypothetical protein ACTSP0_02445 [Alphaproteobacteria bacterium]
MSKVLYRSRLFRFQRACAGARLSRGGHSALPRLRLGCRSDAVPLCRIANPTGGRQAALAWLISKLSLSDLIGQSSSHL